VLGVDPGFANFGYAVVELGRESDRVVKLGLIATKKDNNKRKTLAADDNVRRCTEIAHELVELTAHYDIVCVCAEAMSFPRNASAAAKVALSWGSIVTLAYVQSIPIVQCSPQQLKQAVCGDRSASKEAVQEVLQRMYSYAPGLLTSVAPSAQEHPYDALGAVVAAKDSDVLKLARRMA
jgi:crossover junction endodeoxyribonuclease RuvC